MTAPDTTEALRLEIIDYFRSLPVGIYEGPEVFADALIAGAVGKRIAALEAERDAARAALEHDRTLVIDVVNKMHAALKGRSWLLEGGRGPYEWDDDRFRAEFAQALDEIAAPLETLRKIGRDWTHCPTDWAEIKAARTAGGR